jgi:sugar/nucleoside kinase (ribokinase family)
VATPLWIIFHPAPFWQGVGVMLGVVGSLTLDLVDRGPPRPGGAVVYAAEALRLLGSPASILTRCAPEHREELLPALAGPGLSVDWIPSAVTTAFSFSYEGDLRRMAVESVGDPWRPEEVDGALPGVEWLHVGGLLRSDFPAETLAVLGRGRVLSLDGQALVRPGRGGALHLNAAFDPGLLGGAQVVTLSEEEAAVLPAASLPVPEVVVTLASRGSIVHSGGESQRIEIEPVRGVDPTGAGDAFAIGYLAARSAGEGPVAAARRASTLVSELLARR